MQTDVYDPHTKGTVESSRRTDISDLALENPREFYAPESGLPIGLIVKSQRAKTLVSEARNMIERAREELERYHRLLVDSRTEFEASHAQLRKSARESFRLLDRLDMPLDEEGWDLDAVYYCDTEPSEPVLLQTLPSSQKNALVYGLIMAFAVLMLWLMVAAVRVHMGASDGVSDSSLALYVGAIGGLFFDQDAQQTAGWLMILLPMLVFGGIAYGLTYNLIENRNLKSAFDLLEAAHSHQKRMQAHYLQLATLVEQIDLLTGILDRYHIILEEQNAKLRRIHFFEGDVLFEAYHVRSKTTIADTHTLLRHGVALLRIAGRAKEDLNEKSSMEDEYDSPQKRIQQARSVLHAYLEKLY
jgi:hypothetical protein